MNNMEKKDCIAIFLCLLACLTTLSPDVCGARRQPEHNNKFINVNRPMKMFVFGDSYADTGNWPPSNAYRPWREPYGITFPGKPSGRWSDGRVLTDYIALYMGLESPEPYGMWKDGREAEQYGMNFAYGGTGVFDTNVGGPNMTTQITFLQHLLQQNVYTKQDLSSSIALLTSVGNDYSKLADAEHIEDFVESIIRQLSLNLKRIHGMGIPKVGVTAMQPLGCLPAIALGTTNCDNQTNNITRFHNQMLKQNVHKLNNQTNDSPFVILDLYLAFTSVLNIQHDRPGNSSFEYPLLPCCTNKCGDVDENGEKEYRVCNDPKKSFFWDATHPSQQGWFAVYSALKPSLHSLLLPHLLDQM